MAQANQIVSNIFPYLRVLIQVQSWQHETLALIDTGFEGGVAVPFSVSGALSDPDSSVDWQQADGSIAEAPVYSGNIEILGFPPIHNVIVVALSDEFILGREILDRFEITLDHGHRVIIRT